MNSKFKGPEVRMCLTRSKNSKVNVAEAKLCRVLQTRKGFGILLKGDGVSLEGLENDQIQL